MSVDHSSSQSTSTHLSDKTRPIRPIRPKVRPLAARDKPFAMSFDRESTRIQTTERRSMPAFDHPSPIFEARNAISVFPGLESGGATEHDAVSASSSCESLLALADSLGQNGQPEVTMSKSVAAEVHCVLDVARAERDIERAKKQLLDSRLHATFTRMRLLRMQVKKAAKRVNDAERGVGRIRYEMRQKGCIPRCAPPSGTCSMFDNNVCLPDEVSDSDASAISSSE